MKEIKELISENMANQFCCKPAGTDRGEFFARTETVLGEGASASDLDLIHKRLKMFSKEFSELYCEFNGAEFHRDTNSDAAGLWVHPIEDWDEVTSMMKDWYEIIDEDELEEIGVDWLETGIAFAEVPHSGNYFVLALEGSNAGKILYSDHDGLESEPYADTLFQFLKKYLEAPEKEMYRLGCHTRYSDGKTDIQWIPEEQNSP